MHIDLRASPIKNKSHVLKLMISLFDSFKYCKVSLIIITGMAPHTFMTLSLFRAIAAILLLVCPRQALADGRIVIDRASCVSEFNPSSE
jgi:hypothetical protein